MPLPPLRRRNSRRTRHAIFLRLGAGGCVPRLRSWPRSGFRLRLARLWPWLRSGTRYRRPVRVAAVVGSVVDLAGERDASLRAGSDYSLAVDLWWAWLVWFELAASLQA